MKTLKLVFISSFLFLQQLAYSQVTYFDYLDTTSQWHIRSEGAYGGGCGFIIYKTDIVSYIMGDTLIAGNWYYKIYNYRIDSNFCSSNMVLWSIDTSNYLSGFYREAPNKKIYQYNGSSEVLVWDFNYGTAQNPCSYMNIDTVWLGARPLKKYICSCTMGSYWIEGVGADMGGFFSPYFCTFFIHGNTYLVCYKKQNDVLVVNNQYACKFDINTGIKEMDENSNIENLVKVYPNPIDNNLMLELDISLLNKKANANIINTLGQNIISKRIIDAKTDFDLASLPNGVYFVEIITEGGKFVKKIVKQ